MASSPDTGLEPSVVAAKHGGRLLPPARYRHPGHLTRLIVARPVLAGARPVTVAAHATYAGASAAAMPAVAPSTLAVRVLAGLVLAGFAVAVAVTVRFHRFRLLAGLAGAAAVAGAAPAGFVQLAGGRRPRAIAAGALAPGWLSWQVLQRREHA